MLFISELAIQIFFIKKHKATYSEFYYDICRESHPNGKFRTGLTILVAALAPMLKDQFDSLFTSLKLKSTENPADMTRFQKLFVIVYPYINLGWESAQFLYLAKYLLDEDWPYFGFLYHILKQKVVKIEDQAQDSSKRSMIVDFIKKYFVFFIFIGMKFLEWKFDSTRRRNENMQLQENLKIEAPFTKEAAANICPICHSKIVSPCCLTVSAYVFCQGCIYDYISRESKCPVTGIHANASNINRLYV